jgi:para-nitrobenzyl esterase
MAVLLLANVLPAILPVAAANAPSPVIQIASGRVQGVARDGLMIFEGIPYAAPPVGRLRWQPPQPVMPWSGVRSAVHFEHDCMQLPDPHDDTPLRTTPSEDCLYLNVWAPLEHAQELPVIVWIYGGGFVNGGSSPAVYSGAAFVRQGLVFVSFNYRVGRFGFFALPALVKQGGLVGNYAFMDQIAALEWVRRNIAAFGGDPHEVTIFGESAGGMSVNVLLTSPLAHGLFQRAMIESGGGRDTILSPASLDHPGPRGQHSAEQDAVAFARRMGIQGDGAAALAALRRLPAQKIVDGLNMPSMRQQQDIYSGPMIDGKVMVQRPEDVFKEGGQAKVPVVVGANSADLGFTTAHTLAALLVPFGARRAEALRAFDPGGHASVRVIGQRIATVRDMIEPARFVARSVAAAGEPAYEYRFSYVAASVRGKFPGAPHASEVPYVFDTIRKYMWGNFGKGVTAQDLAMARTVNEYWVNFARTGNPNGPGLPHWPAITPDGNQLMNFTMKGAKGEIDPWKTRLDLVQPLQP